MNPSEPETAPPGARDAAAGPAPHPLLRPATLLKAAVSLALIAWIISTANLREIGTALAHADFRWIGLAFLLQFVGAWLVAVRWGGLLRAQGVDLPHGLLLRSVFASFFFRQILPSTVGGDAIRAYDTWRAGASKSVAVLTVLVDRLLGLMALGLFAVAALALAPQLGARFPLIDLWVVLGAAALVGGVAALFVPPRFLVRIGGRLVGLLPGPIARRAGRILAALSAFQGKHGTLAASVLLSLVLQANVVLFYYLIGRAMGFPIPLGAYFLIVPIATFVMMLPVSINGIGIRESIFALLLGAYGIDAAAAVAFAWLEFGSFLVYGVIGGVVYAATHPRREAFRAAAEIKA